MLYNVHYVLHNSARRRRRRRHNRISHSSTMMMLIMIFYVGIFIVRLCCGVVWMIHSHRKHVINGRNAQNTRLINLYALSYLNNVYMDAQHSTHSIKCKTDMEKLWRVRVPNDPSTYSHTRTHVLVGSIHREAHFMEITFSDCALCCAVCCRCAHITSNCCLHNF